MLNNDNLERYVVIPVFCCFALNDIDGARQLSFGQTGNIPSGKSLTDVSSVTIFEVYDMLKLLQNVFTLEG